MYMRVGIEEIAGNISLGDIFLIIGYDDYTKGCFRAIDNFNFDDEKEDYLSSRPEQRNNLQIHDNEYINFLINKKLITRIQLKTLIID